MSQTPAAGAAPYCAPATFLLYYDNRVVGQLVRSDGTEASPTDLLTDPVLANMLAQASGEVEAACAVAGRYLPADLAALAAAAGNGAALLAGIVAPLAYGKLRELRGLTTDTIPQVAAAQQSLADLRDGAAVFPFVEAEAASVPATVRYTPADLRALRRPTDLAAPLFGRRDGGGRGIGGWGTGW